MRTITTLAALAALVALPACTSEAASAAGTYEVKLDIAGMPEEMAKMMEAMKPGVLTLKADGTWSVEMSMMGQTDTSSGTWKMEGGDIVMTATDENGEPRKEPDTKRGPYKDGAFSITMEEGGQKLTMHMTKKK